MTRIPDFKELDLSARSDKAEIESLFKQIATALETQNILDSISEAIMILNRNRQVIYANPKTIELLEVESVTDILGLRPGELLGCEKAAAAKNGCGTTPYCEYCGALSAILQGQSGKQANEECRITNIHTRTALDLKIKISPFANDNLMYVIFGFADISDIKRKEMLEKIFFHDLLNTAGGLHGYTELLMTADPNEEFEIKPIISKLSGRIIDEIQAQRQLIQAENGQLAISVSQNNSSRLIEDLIESYQEHEVIREKIVEKSPTCDSIDFLTDPVLLNRVLGNLIKNALEAVQAKGIVTIGCKGKQETVQFWVNNKTVIPDDIQKQLFQRSFSTKGMGRGLGTYSIRLLTEKYLKGNVSFRSETPTGTTFFVEIPKNLNPNEDED